MWYRVLLLIGCQLSCQVAAAQYTLQIQPDKCAISVQSPVCQTQLRISISGDTEQQLCVSVGSQQQCQHHSASAPSQFVFSIKTSQSLPVILRDTQQQLLLTRQFSVFQFVEQPKRPRRSYLWNNI